MENTQEFHVQIAAELGSLKQIALDTLDQTKRTNGRVTKLEDGHSLHSTRLALIESGDAAATTRSNWWKDKVGTAFIALLFTAVGSAVLLVLQKTEIIDVSVVSDEEYDQLP